MNNSITKIFLTKLGENIILILALIWELLWILPWASWLNFSAWGRLGITLLFFTTPGMALSLILAGKRLSLPSHFVSGLAISVFIVGILGLIGRIFHLPFAFIEPVFALAGVIALLGLYKHSRKERQLYKPKRFTIVTLVVLLVLAILGILTVLQSKFFGDDYSYLAYLTNWQHAQPLNFEEVYFGSGGIDVIRFWSAMLPMNFALMAQVSHLSGLMLLGYYLEPFIMVIALLAIFNLFDDLLPSESQAIAAVLLQFTILFLLRNIMQDPGTAFFDRLSEDKAFAAFVLAPAFFVAIRYLLETFSIRSGIFVVLIGLSLALTHPIILAYAIFIAGVYVAIVTISRRNFKRLGITLALLMIIILPSASLRFVKAPSRKAPFNLNSALNNQDIGIKISYIEGTPFYGFNLERIRIQTNNPDQENLSQVFFSWSYLWILGLGFIWSLFNLRRNASAPFIAAASLLIILCAIPYTGWLVGYFVSARMLWRSPWLLPIGLSGVVLLAELLKYVLRKASTTALSKISPERVLLALVSVICFILIGYFSIEVYGDRWQALAKLRDYKIHLTKYTILGNYLEENIEQPSVFLASRGLMDYLPGISSKSKPVYFRNSNFTQTPVYLDEISEITTLDPSISMEQRIKILQKYHVDYVIIQNPRLKKYYVNESQYFSAKNIAGFWLLEFHGSQP